MKKFWEGKLGEQEATMAYQRGLVTRGTRPAERESGVKPSQEGMNEATP